MRIKEMKTTFDKPEVFTEQFIPDHTFVYILKGKIHCYDGTTDQVLATNECYLFRKDYLVKYYEKKGELELVRVCLEERFLKRFQEKHKAFTTKIRTSEILFLLNKTELTTNYVESLTPYYHSGEIDEPFADVKKEELLLILLQNQPELAGIFFDYRSPEKVDLQAFMNRNYKFNVNIDRFAYLTGRSLSAFKRDFVQVFDDTPSRWLVARRLQEARFLIDQKDKKPTEIYLDLGFEDLSHFSHAFKNRFGLTPSELLAQKKTSSH